MQHRKNNSESGEHHHQQQQAQSHHSSRKSGYVNSGAETEADTTSHASIKRNRRRQRLVILRLDTNQISNQSFFLPNSFFKMIKKVVDCFEIGEACKARNMSFYRAKRATFFQNQDIWHVAETIRGFIFFTENCWVMLRTQKYSYCAVLSKTQQFSLIINKFKYRTFASIANFKALDNFFDHFEKNCETRKRTDLTAGDHFSLPQLSLETREQRLKKHLLGH